MRTTLRAAQCALGALAVLALTVLPGSPASAHAALQSSDPKADTTVTQPLTQVTLTFNQAVKQQFSEVKVTGADGVVYGDGAARSVDANLIQAVKPLPAGAVTIVWRTVSADGHSIQGQFAFTNAFAPPSPSPSPAASPTPAAPSTPGAAQPGVTQPVTAPRSDESSAGGVWIAVVVGLVVVAALGGVFLWRRRTR
jgi:MYXO-CTERM domain-containing protein